MPWQRFAIMASIRREPSPLGMQVRALVWGSIGFSDGANWPRATDCSPALRMLAEQFALRVSEFQQVITLVWPSWRMWWGRCNRPEDYTCGMFAVAWIIQCHYARTHPESRCCTRCLLLCH